MLRYAAFATLLMLPGVAQAQDWRLASQGTSTGSMFFIDADSVGAPQARTQGKAFMLMARPDRGVTAIETVLEFECSTGRKRIVSMVPYDRMEDPGKLFEGGDEWEDTPANTQFGALWEIICGKVPMPEESYGSAPPFAAGRKLMNQN